MQLGHLFFSLWPPKRTSPWSTSCEYFTDGIRSPETILHLLGRKRQGTLILCWDQKRTDHTSFRHILSSLPSSSKYSPAFHSSPLENSALSSLPGLDFISLTWRKWTASKHDSEHILLRFQNFWIWVEDGWSDLVSAGDPASTHCTKTPPARGATLSPQRSKIHLTGYESFRSLEANAKKFGFCSRFWIKQKSAHAGTVRRVWCTGTIQKSLAMRPKFVGSRVLVFFFAFCEIPFSKGMLDPKFGRLLDSSTLFGWCVARLRNKNIVFGILFFVLWRFGCCCWEMSKHRYQRAVSWGIKTTVNTYAFVLGCQRLWFTTCWSRSRHLDALSSIQCMFVFFPEAKSVK